ncbi:MAG: hypothetical protein M3Q16_00955 [Pseudomonadota bacterium]|nr:hypothetical protein [Pseudomonadota bacterium]
MQITIPAGWTVLGGVLLVMVSSNLPARSLADSADYDQCVLESVKGVTSLRATDAAIRGCREKSRIPELSDIVLPPYALGKLVVQAGFGYGIFSGTIYNGNNEYAITQITILLTPATAERPDETLAGSREYNIDLLVQPFNRAALSMPILSDNTLEYLWEVTKARGYKPR